MTLLSPCIRSIGPKNAKILLIGEAPGREEEIAGIPFVGTSGRLLDEMLKEANILRREVFFTNVLFTRPPGNKLDEFLVGKKDLPSDYSLLPLRQGKYLHPDLEPEIRRLRGELNSIKPNLIICAGGTALWALIGTSSITKFRGSVQPSLYGKVLPILHPATVAYDWSNRPIIVGDLIKAKHESTFPDIIRPERWITIDPTLQEVRDFCRAALQVPILSVDTETHGGQISILGFATSRKEAISIPFLDFRRDNKCYWSRDEEIAVRREINRVLASGLPKLFQNGLYDIQYLLREGYRLNNVLHDTMILHHALHPELPKSLSFLGAAYTNEASWKVLRPRGRDDFKKEE